MSEPTTEPGDAEHWKHVAEELLRRVVWALKFMDVPGSGLVWRPGNEDKMQTWEEWFFDAIDLTGNKVDRAAWYESKNAKKKRRRKK